MEQHRRQQKNRLSLGKKKEEIQGGSSPITRMPSQRDNRAQGSTGHVQKLSTPGPSGHAHRPTGPSQDSQQIAPGQIARSDSQTPQTSSESKLSQVTHQFVTELKRSVESKFTHLAILEEKRDNFSKMMAGEINIPAEFRVVRELPGLAPGCKFSVLARAELEKLFEAHDLAFLNVLRDDLESRVIPGFEVDIDEALSSARRKLDSGCPESELHLARRRFEEELEKKREGRQGLLKRKRESLKENRVRQAAKRPRVEQGPPPPHHSSWWGPPPPYGQQHWRQRQSSDFNGRGRPRGRGRGRGRRF